MCSASVFVNNRYEYFKNVGGLNHVPHFQSANVRTANHLSRYTRNVQRLPQVVFHAVKSGYCSGFIGLSAQFNYVLGKAERVIDPSGEFDGRDHMACSESKNLASRWADNWKKTRQDGKHTMHLVASFPHGTPEGAVHCIIRDTCEELLSQGRNRFDYIAAIHTDTNNPHGHIIVNRRNGEGEWFYLARDHEFNYDLFKDTLVKHAQTYGIALNNSSRLSRGIGDYALDSNPNMAMRGLEGVILDYGSAAYKHQIKGSDSYYVTLQTRFGERMIWGVGLATVLENSGAMRGDTIRLRHEGKRPINIHTRDGETITTHRNDWRIDFSGVEYGAFDRCDTETPTSKEQQVADKRRDLILQEAGRYRRFAEFFKGAQIALSMAFQAASDALHSGNRIDDLSPFQENIMREDVSQSAADITRERDALFASLEEARNKLNAVWEHLPNIPDQERPVMEERYFDALGKMERLLAGEQRREFSEQATDSIYADEYRHKLARQIPMRSLQCLEQYGISRDEFMARTQIGTCSHILETHWIERDIESIGQHLKLDLQTAEGRQQAIEAAIEMHSFILEDLAETEHLTLQDWQQLGELRKQFAGAAQGAVSDAETEWEDAYKTENNAFTQYAQKSPLHAELASFVLDIEAHDKNNLFMNPKLYIAPEDRVLLNGYAVQYHIDLDTEGGRINGLRAIETHYFGTLDADTLHEIRDLAHKNTLTFEESKRIIEGLNEVLGKNGMDEIHHVNTDVFRDGEYHKLCVSSLAPAGF